MKRILDTLMLSTRLVHQEEIGTLGHVAGSARRAGLPAMPLYLQTILADANSSVVEYMSIARDEIARFRSIVSDLLDARDAHRAAATPECGHLQANRADSAQVRHAGRSDGQAVRCQGSRRRAGGGGVKYVTEANGGRIDVQSEAGKVAACSVILSAAP